MRALSIPSSMIEIGKDRRKYGTPSRVEYSPALLQRRRPVAAKASLDIAVLQFN